MKYQEPTKLVDYGSMPKLPQLELDRTAKTLLAEQIRNGIECAAMAEPRAFPPGAAECLSWVDAHVMAMTDRSGGGRQMCIATRASKVRAESNGNDCRSIVASFSPIAAERSVAAPQWIKGLAKKLT